jgi:hypothetical protein
MVESDAPRVASIVGIGRRRPIKRRHCIGNGFHNVSFVVMLLMRYRLLIQNDFQCIQ